MKIYYFESSGAWINQDNGTRKYVNTVKLSSCNVLSPSELEKKMSVPTTFKIPENRDIKVHVLGLTKFDTSGFDGIKNCNVDNKMDVVVFDKDWLSNRRKTINAVYLPVKIIKQYIQEHNKFHGVDPLKENPENYVGFDTLYNLPDDEKIYMTPPCEWTCTWESKEFPIDAGFFCCIHELCKKLEWNTSLADLFTPDKKYVKEKYVKANSDGNVEQYILYNISFDDIPLISSEELASMMETRTGYKTMSLDDLKSFVSMVNSYIDGHSRSKETAKMVAGILCGFNWSQSLQYVLYGYATLTKSSILIDAFIESKRGKMLKNAYNLYVYSFGSVAETYMVMLETNDMLIHEDIYKEYIEPDLNRQISDTINSFFSNAGDIDNDGKCTSVKNLHEYVNKYKSDHLK